MCIIVYKPKGIEKPTRKTLRKCWENNDDGAGIVKIGKISTVKKGYTTFKSFYKAYQSFKFTIESEYALHFRIGTSGGNSPGNTHPFPISDNMKELKTLEYRSNAVIMHNGILGEGNKTLSDTMLFVRDYMTCLYPYIDDPKIMELITNLSIGSRLLIINKGKAIMTGNGWEDNQGVYYSNDTYYIGRWNYNQMYGYIDYKYEKELEKEAEKHESKRYLNDIEKCPYCEISLVYEKGAWICDNCGFDSEIFDEKVSCPCCGSRMSTFQNDRYCTNCSTMTDINGKILYLGDTGYNTINKEEECSMCKGVMLTADNCNSICTACSAKEHNNDIEGG